MSAELQKKISTLTRELTTLRSQLETLSQINNAVDNIVCPQLSQSIMSHQQGVLDYKKIQQLETAHTQLKWAFIGGTVAVLTLGTGSYFGGLAAAGSGGTASATIVQGMFVVKGSIAFALIKQQSAKTNDRRDVFLRTLTAGLLDRVTYKLFSLYCTTTDSELEQSLKHGIQTAIRVAQGLVGKTGKDSKRWIMLNGVGVRKYMSDVSTQVRRKVNAKIDARYLREYAFHLALCNYYAVVHRDIQAVPQRLLPKIAALQQQIRARLNQLKGLLAGAPAVPTK